MFRESAEANVFGRSSFAVGEEGEGACGGFAADSEVGTPATAKGLFGIEEGIENGFAELEVEVGFAPNNASPILTGWFTSFVSILGSMLLFSFLLYLTAAGSVIITHLRA